MKLTIVKIGESVYMGDFERISLPTTDGIIEILPGHSPYMAGLKKGFLLYKTESGEEKIEIDKGFVEVNKLEVLVIL